MKGSLPQRKQLHHTPPNWVPDSDLFFITVNGEPRGLNQFAKNETGTFILKSAKYYQENEHWFCRLILVMPDHIHALARMSHKLSTARRNIRTGAALVGWRDFAGCRPSFTRASSRNPHQHWIFIRSPRNL